MKNLKNLINEQLRISIRKFAKEIGISRQTVYNIMMDNNKPTILTVKKICGYFGENYKDYICGDDDESKR